MSEINAGEEEVREGGSAGAADDESGDSNGYVHVGPTDVPAEDGGDEVSVFVESANDSSNQEKNIEQSDGQSASADDSIQNAPSDIRVTEDGGREDMFVDCPDEIPETPLASEEKDDSEETQVMGLGNRLQVHDFNAEIEHLHYMLEKTAAERDSFAQKYEEEKTASMKQFTRLHDQLKCLNEQSKGDGELVDHRYKPDVGDEEPDVINKCYKYLETFSNERSETEGIIKELHGILSMNDQEIESLRMMVNELSVSRESSAVQLEKCQHIEGVVDRMLNSLNFAVNQEEMLDESVVGKISHVEKATAFLLEKYYLFHSEVDQLRWCLVEVAPDISMQDEVAIFFSARNIIHEFRRKIVDLDQKLSQAEDENRQLLEQLHNHKAMVENANAEIGNLNAGLQQEKTKLANTKEKLSLAVTKGKALVQQRDSLKQALADKTSELEKCLSELQEKSSALEAAEQSKELLIKNENLTASLQEALTQKETVLQKCGEIISEADVTEELQSMDIIEKVRWLTNERNTMKGINLEFDRLTDALSSFDFPETVKSKGLDVQIGWLLESFNAGKEDAAKWHDEISRAKEAASNDIDHLTTTLLAETQEKNYLQAELEDLRSKYEGIVGKEYQASMEKNRIVDTLLEASGITLDNQEKNYRSLRDVATVIDKCIAKVKDDVNIAFDISRIEVGSFENIQSLLYTRDMELTLYSQICEEEMLDRVEVASLSNELAVLRNELSVLEDEKDTLRKDLERSEEKAALLREKLSMAVKKGKGLVQERENLKKMLDERNIEIENLKLELKQQVSTCNDYMDQINKLSADMEHISKLEADVTAIKEEKNEVEKSLVESSNMLQRVFELIDGIVLPADSVFEVPIEKVQWVAGYVGECQSAKIQVEQELRKVKDEASALASKLDEVQMTVKLLQDASSVAESKISELLEEKKELEVSKMHLEQELEKAIEEASSQTIKYAEVCASQKSLEDTLQMAENKISMLINEKEEALASSDAAEMEIQKVKEEILFHTSRHADTDKTIQSLEDALSYAQQNVSFLEEDNRKAIRDKMDLEKEINKLKGEVNSLVVRFSDANSTITSLEDSLLDAQSKISDLLKEKNNAEEEISALRRAISDKTDLEKEIEKLKDEVDSHAVRSTDAKSTVKSLEDSLLDAESKISDLLKEKSNAEQEISALRNATSDKMELEKEIKKLKDEVDSHVLRFTDAKSTIRSLEDSLSDAESKISDLLKEKNNAEEEILSLRNAIGDKMDLENEIKKLKDEVDSHVNRYNDANSTIRSLEDSLFNAESKISELLKEKNNAEEEISALNNAFNISHIEAGNFENIQILLYTRDMELTLYGQICEEEMLDRVEVASLSNELTVLRNELSAMKDEKDSLRKDLERSEEKAALLREKLSMAVKKGKGLVQERENLKKMLDRRNTEIENLKLELAGIHGSLENRSMELSAHLSRLRRLMKDGTLPSLLQQSFEKKFGSLNDMNILLGEIRDHILEIDSKMVQNDSSAEDDTSMPTLLSAGVDNRLDIEKSTGEELATNGDNIVFHIGKYVEELHLRDKFLEDKVESISSFMDNLITSLLTKLQATKHGFVSIKELIKSLKQEVNDMEMDRRELKNTAFMLESHIGSLLPACTDATKELESEFQSCLSVLRSNSELGKLNETLSMEFGTVCVEAAVEDQLERDNRYEKAAVELLSAARQSRNFNIHFRNVVNKMIVTIDYLQNELSENKKTSEKVLEERDLFQNKITKLESDLKASENLCMETRRKLDDYQEKWKTLNEREAELSSSSLKKIQDAEDSLLSASQMKSLFDKIIRIEVPLSELEGEDLQLQDSADVRKLFYIIDSYTELKHQISLVSCDKEWLRSTLERHVHEIEDLKKVVEEDQKDKNSSEKLKSELLGLAIGLEKVIQKVGGEELVEHPADVTELLQVLERLVLSTKMESENFKSKAEELGIKLLGTQKLVDDLSSKVRLLDDSSQSRVASTETLQARGNSGSSSSPAQSEISEIQDTGPVGTNKSIRSVSPVAHPRTLRKGSSDHLAINIDSESKRLISEETSDDKGHVFKSLNTSGLVPRQGKIIADRVDGIWVSGSRALMNHPRARLGLITYWLFVHLWLLGTIL